MYLYLSDYLDVDQIILCFYKMVIYNKNSYGNRKIVLSDILNHIMKVYSWNIYAMLEQFINCQKMKKLVYKYSKCISCVTKLYEFGRHRILS